MTGRRGSKRRPSGEYDLAILDVMLPKMNGFEVLTNLRQSSDMPV